MIGQTRIRLALRPFFQCRNGYWCSSPKPIAQERLVLIGLRAIPRAFGGRARLPHVVALGAYRFLPGAGLLSFLRERQLDVALAVNLDADCDNADGAKQVSTFSVDGALSAGRKIRYRRHQPILHR